MAKTQSKHGIDKALRYLYNTLRNSRIEMAIEFKHGGRVWRADTPEEAIALRRKLEAADQEALSHGFPPDWSKDDGSWTPDTVTDLLREAGPNQKGLLMLLHEREGMVPSGDVIRALGLSSEVALAGVLSGLSKQLKKLGLKTWDLYTTHVTWDGKTKARWFQLAGDFVKEAEKLGWPEGWKDYEKTKRLLKIIKK